MCLLVSIVAFLFAACAIATSLHPVLSLCVMAVPVHEILQDSQRGEYGCLCCWVSCFDDILAGAGDLRSSPVLSSSSALGGLGKS